MTITLRNNVSTTLGAPISTTGSLPFVTVASGAGARFPTVISPGAGSATVIADDPFIIAIQEGNNFELLYVYDHAAGSDQMSVGERGYGGTTPATFSTAATVTLVADATTLHPPPWLKIGASRVYALWRDGDPGYAADMLNSADSVAAPTPTALTTTTCRLASFSIPVKLAVDVVSFFGVAATSNLYKLAIYKRADGSLVKDLGPFLTAANSWGGITNITGLTLLPDVDYWLAFVANGTGTTAGVRTALPPIHSAVFGADNANPLAAFSGATDRRSMGVTIHAQCTLAVASTFPSTLPAIAAAAYAGGTTGSVPIAFATGTAS